MMHLFANELTRLSCGRFSFASIFFRSLDGFFFWHDAFLLITERAK
jgi:hypothetical protein